MTLTLDASTSFATGSDLLINAPFDSNDALWVRIIGDIHGYITRPNSYQRSYLSLVQDAPCSVALGDIALDYSEIDEQVVNPLYHRFIAGNHDNYNQLTKHFLGDYGEHAFALTPEESFRFFYIRGARSQDKALRIAGKDWFEQEELSYGMAMQALNTYEACQPHIMLTHDCPNEVLHAILNRNHGEGASRTQALLQQCFECWQPKLWIFGHHHKNFITKIKNTVFMCLNELCYVDIFVSSDLQQLTIR